MSEYGFWSLAQKDPEHLALVESDGRRLHNGELLAAANRLVHGLRDLGLRQGDCIATCLPNRAAMIQTYLAAAQAGWYLTPINHHLTAGEIAYIVGDCEAKAFIGDERFAAACRGAADQAGLPASACYAVGAVPGFQPLAELADGQPETMPEGRAAGQVMNYTSGTTGRPKGVRRPLAPYDPDAVFSMFAMFLAMFGVQPEADNVHLCGSPLYHTAVLVFAGSSLHYGHAVVLMDKWTPELCLDHIGRYHVTTSHMVPTQFHRLLALPAEVRARADVS